MEDIRPIVIPDDSPETAWLGQSEEIAFNDHTGTLLAIQSGGRVVEFDTAGRHIQTYGRSRGSGPGELSSVEGLSVYGNLVAVLDRGNLKVVVFERKGTILSEFRISERYREVVLLPDSLIGFVPGDSVSAFDVYDFDGVRIAGRGTREDLPVRCDTTGGCSQSQLVCTGCKARRLDDSGRLAVLGTEEGILVVFGPDGDGDARVDYLFDDSLVSAWARVDAPETARAQAKARERHGERTEVFKSYFTSLDVANGNIIVSVVPAAAEFRNRGYELWVIDPGTGAYQRHGYPRRGPGFQATSDGTSRAYALDMRSGGIFGLNMRTQ